MKKNLLSNFFICGFIGWCLECLWTGLNSIIKRDKSLKCNTSIWMFPIYGMAAFLSHISKLLKNKNVFKRGVFYFFNPIYY